MRGPQEIRANVLTPAFCRPAQLLLVPRSEQLGDEMERGMLLKLSSMPHRMAE